MAQYHCAGIARIGERIGILGQGSKRLRTAIPKGSVPCSLVAMSAIPQSKRRYA